MNSDPIASTRRADNKHLVPRRVRRSASQVTIMRINILSIPHLVVNSSGFWRLAVCVVHDRTFCRTTRTRLGRDWPASIRLSPQIKELDHVPLDNNSDVERANTHLLQARAEHSEAFRLRLKGVYGQVRHVATQLAALGVAVRAHVKHRPVTAGRKPRKKTYKRAITFMERRVG